MEPYADHLAAIDVVDRAFIADPYPALSALREATPIVHDPRTDQWLVTRFADVQEALRDRRFGRSYTHRFTDAELGRAAPDQRWARFHEHERWSLLSLEPPDHTRLRRLVSKVFTPRAVDALRPSIQQLANELLGNCVEQRRFDLIADYAQPFSMAVICTMLGVPRDHTQQLLDWSHAIVKMYELATPDNVKQVADHAAGNFIAYTREVMRDKRRQPDSSLVSELVAVEDGGDHLSEAEITSTVMVLLEAGHEATVNSLANGMRAMLVHPDEWAAVTSGRVAPRTAIEEMIRWDSPLQLFERWVLEPGVEIAGTSVPVGAELALLFGSANRDPRRFGNADRFDAGRGDTAHVGFGGGIHFCIGAPLARAELDVSVAALAAMGPSLHMVEQPQYQPTFVLRGLDALHLSIE